MSNSVLDSIKAMRDKAKKTETRYYTPKGGKNLNPGDLKEGKTIIRVAPSHNDNFPSPFVPFRSTYLEVELSIDELSNYNMNSLIDKKSLKKDFGIEKLSDLSEWSNDKIKDKLKSILGDNFHMKVNKRIFIATLHGKEGHKDLVEEYIKFVVNKVSSEIGDRDESRKKLAPIFGWRDSNGKWNPGIQPSNSFIFYGWDWEDKNLYKIEIYGKMMDRIEDLYVKFDGEDEPLTIDPFSDPERGVCLQIDKAKNNKGKWDYKIDDVPFSGKKFDSYKQFIEQFKLSKEQLGQLKELKPLDKSFGRGSFKASDFKIQLKGLVLFDEKWGYDVFENDEFLELVEQIAGQWSEEKEAEEKEKANNSKDIDDIFKEKPGKVKKKEEETKGKLKELISQKDGVVKKEEENSFKEEVTESKNSSDNKFNSRLEALRKNLK